LVRFPQRIDHPVRRPGRDRAVGAGNEHDELVAPETGQHGLPRGGRGQSTTDLNEQVVTGSVAARVVDALKPI
jgi:hypothetical protein